MGSFPLGPHKPMVRIQVGYQPVTFMMDTQVEHSVVTTPVAPFSSNSATIFRAMGTWATKQPFPKCLHKIGGHKVCHKFLYMSHCPIPIDRDPVELFPHSQCAVLMYGEGSSSPTSCARQASRERPVQNLCRIFFSQAAEGSCVLKRL